MTQTAFVLYTETLFTALWSVIIPNVIVLNVVAPLAAFYKQMASFNRMLEASTFEGTFEKFN